MENEFLGAVLPWWNVLTTIVTVASAITAATPTTKDDIILGKVMSVIRLLGLNIGRAKPSQ